MDRQLTHLQMIQAVITRMAGNSFLIKGWSVTLVAALFALAAADTERSRTTSYVKTPCPSLISQISRRNCCRR